MKNIAVVIVNWNGKKYLKDCLDSLEVQTTKDFKIIFVDNGSEDNSVDFVEKNYSRMEIIKLQRNTGFCFGYNTGIKKALEDKNVDYVIVLNNDTKLDEKYIEELQKFAKRHPDAGSIQPKILNIFEKNKVDCAGIYITRDGTAHNRGYGKNAEKYSEEKEIFGANGTASLFTRRALEKTVLPDHNYFDNDHFAFYEDVDLAWRMKNAGFKSYFCPKALVFHVHSGTAGKASLMKAYYLHRNYFFTIFKNYPCGKMVGTLFWRFLSYLRLAANISKKKKREMEFVKGHSKREVALVILKAWGSVIYNLPRLMEKRGIIKKRCMKFKIDWKIGVFSLVVILAIFLRVWHFSDWLFFKMDQARDASTTKQAFELGPGWLPLLGPKAGGTHVNLGPAFYYFQYLSAVLFQNVNPATLAYPDLLFSILSIPLFYFFLKKYFSRGWSMILAGIYAVCFLGVQYSRFAWNPNSLVFFNLLYFYSLLNIFDENIKRRFRWIVVASLSFAVSTQLHFLSFATLPIITFVFVLFIRKEIKKYLNWKKIAVFAGIILLIYLPVFLNEFLTHGRNTNEFFAALKNKPSQHSLQENIIRDWLSFGQHWLLILTGWISKKSSLWPAIIAWLGAIIPGLFLGMRLFRKEKSSIRQKFLLISLLWFATYFLMYIPIAYQMRPRFFLPILALPFIFLGYTAKYFWEKNRKIFKAGASIFLAVVLLGNLYGTYLWFKEINSAQKKGIYPKRTIVLKARDGIVLWHLEKAADYIKKDCPSKEIYYNASSEYKRPVKYILDLAGNKVKAIDAIKAGSQSQCVYALGLSRAGKIPVNQKISSEFNISEQRRIGALSVYKLSLKENFFGQSLPTYKSGVEESEKSNRFFWKDLWK